MPELALRAHFQRDWLAYVRRHHSRASLVVSQLAVVLLTGLVPALTRLLRGRPADAGAQLRLARDVLR